MTITKKRDPYFDNVKFILILLVVVGHIIEPINSGLLIRTLYITIYTFHIPLFVFIVGYFSKNVNAPDYTKKVISKLVIPYFIFETLYTIFDYLIFQRETFTLSYFLPYWIMWFFFSMILWKTALPYVKNIRFLIPITVLLGVLAGYADIGYYASISRTIVFFPFFMAGFFFNREYLDTLCQNKFRIMAAAILACFILVVGLFGQDLELRWLYGSFSYAQAGHNEWFAGIYRLALYAVATVISLCVLILISQHNIRFISGLGRNTLYTYLLHGFIIKGLVYCDFYSYIKTAADIVLLIIFAVAISILLSMSGIRKTFSLLIEPKAESLFKS